MKTELLREKIRQSGKGMAVVASGIHIDASTLWRKLQGGGGSFTVAQADALKDVLGLSSQEAYDIFFGQ